MTGDIRAQLNRMERNQKEILGTLYDIITHQAQPSYENTSRLFYRQGRLMQCLADWNKD